MKLKFVVRPVTLVTASGRRGEQRVRLSAESRDALLRGLDLDQREALLRALLNGPRPPELTASRRAVESAVFESLGPYGPEVVAAWLSEQDERQPSISESGQLRALAARARDGLRGLAALARGEAIG
jgi:hypothetical protein